MSQVLSSYHLTLTLQRSCTSWDSLWKSQGTKGLQVPEFAPAGSDSQF